MNEPPDQIHTAPAELAAPSAAQKVLLREIQNTAKQCADMLEAHRIVGEVTGTLAPQSFYSVYQRHVERGRELEAIARAGGVPQNWIAHVRGKGEQSISWHDDRKYWPPPQSVDRDALIAALSAEARALQTALAVAATGRIFGASGERLWPVGQLSRVMAASWERIAGVGLLLDPSAAEREQIWPSGPDWAYTTVAAVHDWDDRSLEHWRDTEFSRHATASEQPTHIPDLAGLALTDHELIVAPLSELADLAGAAHRSLGHPTEHLAADRPGHAGQITSVHGQVIADAVAAAALDQQRPAASGLDEIATQSGECLRPSLETQGPQP